MDLLYQEVLIHVILVFISLRLELLSFDHNVPHDRHEKNLVSQHINLSQ